MRNPFTEIEPGKRPQIVDRWVTSGFVENKPSGWDLIQHEAEWLMYTIGHLKQLARCAGFGLEVQGVDVRAVAASHAATDMYEAEWLAGLQSIDDIYLDLFLEYLAESGQTPEDHLLTNQLFDQKRRIRKRKSRMAVLSFIMGIMFGGPLLFAAPLATMLRPFLSSHCSAAEYVLACLFLFLGLGFLSFCLGVLAVFRMKFVDKSLTGMPFAVAAIAIPILVFMTAICHAL